MKRGKIDGLREGVKERGSGEGKMEGNILGKE